MNKFYRTELEIGNSEVQRLGVTHTTIGAHVTIETDDEDLHDRLVDAVNLVEALRNQK